MISSNTALLYSTAITYLLSLCLHILNRSRGTKLFLILAAVLNFFYLLLRGFSSGEFMFPHFLTAVHLLPFFISIIIIYIVTRQKESNAESAVILPCFFYAIALLESSAPGVLGPNKISIWSTLFHITIVFGHACFYLGAWYGLLYFFNREESVNFHTLLITGFIMHTAGQVTGAVWCFLGWAMTFQWVYVHMQSAAIWCFYACYIHLVYMQSWNLRSRAGYAAIGGLILLFFGFAAPAGNLLKLIAEV